MRVVFLKDVRGMAKKGEIREVSEGYARNFLIPKGIAKLATESIVKEIDREKREGEAHAAKLDKKHAALAERLKTEILEFSGKANGSELFGSIGEKDILTELRRRGAESVKLALPHPLKSLGEHAVGARIGNSETEIKIRITGK
jgi:large subunit ribosomal protein L9